MKRGWAGGNCRRWAGDEQNLSSRWAGYEQKMRRRWKEDEQEASAEDEQEMSRIWAEDEQEMSRRWKKMKRGCVEDKKKMSRRWSEDLKDKKLINFETLCWVGFLLQHGECLHHGPLQLCLLWLQIYWRKGHSHLYISLYYSVISKQPSQHSQDSV